MYSSLLISVLQRIVAIYKPKEENCFSDPSNQVFHSSHEHNPVASIVQASVPIPVGLDLDTWIVPSMQDCVTEEGGDGAGYLWTGSSRRQPR
ncbi:uncharacterized protein F5891DRAFT_1182310 [Suillus fuscotomentosus]|uniref:Uncharacterized protein n=1 Tax=Suillus fuscotomentosus TaxID=1912939 RepID=A0AAD4HRQ1_9AGAM|nr:uncharacterized protein F5891DRAFT_1182310 [Suillus fuscotomentosus]KAG1906116.1 hypothetical protein F5891DRAFT_1182310 [Suillus fuscotomentosus]